jgi:hypothetical protein
MHLAAPADQRDETGHATALDMAGRHVHAAAPWKIGQCSMTVPSVPSHWVYAYAHVPRNTMLWLDSDLGSRENSCEYSTVVRQSSKSTGGVTVGRFSIPDRTGRDPNAAARRAQ